MIDPDFDIGNYVTLTSDEIDQLSLISVSISGINCPHMDQNESEGTNIYIIDVLKNDVELLEHQLLYVS